MFWLMDWNIYGPNYYKCKLGILSTTSWTKRLNEEIVMVFDLKQLIPKTVYAIHL